MRVWKPGRLSGKLIADFALIKVYVHSVRGPGTRPRAEDAGLIWRVMRGEHGLRKVEAFNHQAHQHVIHPRRLDADRPPAFAQPVFGGLQIPPPRPGSAPGDIQRSLYSRRADPGSFRARRDSGWQPPGPVASLSPGKAAAARYCRTLDARIDWKANSDWGTQWGVVCTVYLPARDAQKLPGRLHLRPRKFLDLIRTSARPRLI